MYKLNYYIPTMFLLLLLAGCKKEATLQPSNKDENYLVVKDNPSDPVEHAIYQFYHATGVPVFYNDTIAREQIGDNDGVPRYSYIKLATAYSPSGINTFLFFRLLSKKEKVLPMLPFLEDKVLPRINGALPVQSILLVDSIRLRGTSGSGTTTTVNKPYVGFNTVIIKAVRADTMSVLSQKSNAASVLAMLMLKKLHVEYSTRLNADFYNISVNSAPGMSVYVQPLSALSPDESLTLEDFGFIKRNPTNLSAVWTPYQQDDLIAYLEALFFYDTTAQFEAVYTAYPLVLQKFKVVKGLAKEIGFSFAD
ncbi:hypothetical protein ACLOAU_15520 [Niabella sp. CJ426]|uniref:hypothetical protein n=1 Tax=Niabella sp. CJ426 TaxID=3393740 RepID=UPI003D0398BC